MYMHLNNDTIVEFERQVLYQGGWKLSEYYHQVMSTEFNGQTSIRCQVKIFGGEPDGATFDWTHDICDQENPEQKFIYVKGIILKIILVRMLECEKSSPDEYQWDKILIHQ